MKKIFAGLIVLFISFGAWAQTVVPIPNSGNPPKFGVVRPNNGAVGMAVVGAAIGGGARAVQMAMVGVPVAVGATTGGTVAAGVAGAAIGGAIIGYVGYKLIMPTESYIVERNP